LKNTGLSVEEIRSKLSGSGSQRQIMFIDACRARAEAGAKGGELLSYRNLGSSSGLRIMNATSPHGTSYEYGDLGNGVFSHFLIKGLQGEAAGPDGLITFNDLRGYVTGEVVKYGEAHHNAQIPYEGGDAQGDFLITRATPPKEETRPLVPVLTMYGSPSQGALNSVDGQHYSWVDPGDFVMGCREGDNDCDDDERPRRRVKITRGFWMAQAETTRRAFQRFVKYTARQMPPDPPFPATDDDPVVGVTWDGADSFCKWIGGRLPTEAQWEYAAGRFPADKTIKLTDLAWYGDNSGDAGLDSRGLLTENRAQYLTRIRENHGHVHPAGKLGYTANSLFDMLGNVLEWCADWYQPKYGGGDTVDPQGPDRGTERVLRGGAWYSPPSEVRISKRFHQRALVTNEWTGFRCVTENISAVHE
jgi:formylglycine-generating enzyme required for sulfatase activity